MEYIVTDADGLWGSVRASTEAEVWDYLTDLVSEGSTDLDIWSTVISLA